MSSIHYKFKSSLDYDTITFDGLSISLGDLKKAIMHQKRMGKSADYDLQITNAQTKKGTSVIWYFILGSLQYLFKELWRWRRVSLYRVLEKFGYWEVATLYTGSV